MKLERALIATSRWLSAHATLSLITVLILMGTTLGLVAARGSLTSNSGLSRSAGSLGLCAHASIGFLPSSSIAQITALLNEEDAHVLYGPDELNQYQLRIGSNGDAVTGLNRIAQSSLISKFKQHKGCE